MWVPHRTQCFDESCVVLYDNRFETENLSVLHNLSVIPKHLCWGWLGSQAMTFFRVSTPYCGATVAFLVEWYTFEE